MNTPDVVDQLCRDNQRLAWSRALHWVKRYRLFALKDEFLSAAMEGLWKAAERYVPAKGRFSVYATIAIDSRIRDVWRNVSRRRAKMPVVTMGEMDFVLDYRSDPPGFELEELLDYYAGLTGEPLARLAMEMKVAGWTMQAMAEPLGLKWKRKERATENYWLKLRKSVNARVSPSQVLANH